MVSIKVIGTQLYQWETGRQVQIFPLRGMKVCAVHFSHLGDAEALVVEPREENNMIVAGIPNVLLQSASNLVVYSVNVSDDCVETLTECVLSVRPRPKPSDYVYTETEVLTYLTLSKRIDRIEEEGIPEEQIAIAVEKYLDENPATGTPGKDGEDGYSPTATVTQTETGATVSITDKDGTTTAIITNGKDGRDGQDGRTPVKGIDYFDGVDGKAGKDGYTPQKGVDYFDGQPGKDGSDGKDGADGYTPVKGKDYFDGKSAYQYAKDGGYTGTEEEFSEKLAKEYPTKVSELANDAGYLTGYTETDPTVPSWAKAATKPSYSKSEVGLGNVDNVKQYSSNNPPPYPVAKVNGKTGDVELDAEDVGARASTWMPTHSDVGADKSGTAASAVSTHNTKTDAHNDIRLLITALTNRLDALANSDDDTLDQMAEVVAYIKSNRNLIEQITTGKVSVSDIVNNLTTNVTNKPLSAAQGVALKALIDAITIPTKLSQLTNDKGYITGYTETDPTVPAWAKAETKPSYTKSEVGLGNVDNAKQYSASNPPPYPVTSVNGNTGAVTLDAADVGARPSTWTPTAANVGAVPTSRKVNGKALSSDITLAASDVGARPSTWTPSASDVGAVPNTQKITVTGVDADGATHTWTMYGVKN